LWLSFWKIYFQKLWIIRSLFKLCKNFSCFIFCSVGLDYFMPPKSKVKLDEFEVRRSNLELEDALFLAAMRVTEQAAIAAGRVTSRGDIVLIGPSGVIKRESTDAMKRTLDQLDIEGHIVVGNEEGKDLMLRTGQRVGKANVSDWKVDVALIAINGPDIVTSMENNLIAVVALSEENGLLKAPDVTMEKLIVGPHTAGSVDLTAPLDTTLQKIAKSVNQKVKDLTIAILNQESHSYLVRQVREAGAQVKFFGGEITAALTTALHGTNIHAVMGSGGAKEGVLAAAALKCLGGEIQARFRPHGVDDEKKLRDADANSWNVYTTKDLAPGENIIFAATGITDGDVLRGVRVLQNGAKTHSVATGYSNRVIRFSEGFHVTGNPARMNIEV
jgi:fructose-1,6-bisphosphatase II